MDELNCALGLARHACASSRRRTSELVEVLHRIQCNLIDVGSSIATLSKEGEKVGGNDLVEFLFPRLSLERLIQNHNDEYVRT